MTLFNPPQSIFDGPFFRSPLHSLPKWDLSLVFIHSPRLQLTSSVKWNDDLQGFTMMTLKISSVRRLWGDNERERIDVLKCVAVTLVLVQNLPSCVKPIATGPLAMPNFTAVCPVVPEIRRRDAHVLTCSQSGRSISGQIRSFSWCYLSWSSWW